MLRSRRRALVLLLVPTFLVLAERPGAGSPPPDGQAWFKEVLRAAEKAEEEGDRVEALAAYRRLLFAGAKSRKIQKRVGQIRQDLSEESVKKAEDLWEQGNRYSAVELLTRAYEFDSRSQLVRSSFEEKGYKLVHGFWWLEAEIAEIDQRDRALGEKRRGEIGLGSEFNIVRRENFRFYTDLDVRKARSVLTQMMDSIDSHLAKYLEVMAVFDPQPPHEGLDVVLFAKEEDYLEVTGAAGTAGVYFPSRGVCYFFRGRTGFNFPTMLHEMTHQLNDKVLGCSGLAAWFEEGSAEYFGAGYLSKRGRKIELGRPDSSRKSTFKQMLAKKKALPLERFLNYTRAQLTAEFYSQSWALAHYLFEGPLPGRFVIYDFIQAGKQKSVGTGAQWVTVRTEDMKKILARYRLTVPQLQAGYEEYHRKN